MSTPENHLVDAEKLEADAYVQLFEIELTDGTKLHLKVDNTVTWQGQQWEGTAIQLRGVGTSADDVKNRPTMSIMNPDGLFSMFVAQGKLTNAKVTRYRVLRSDLEQDKNIYRKQSWRVRRIGSLNRISIQLELRDQLDGQFFLCPGRMFYPPEFPTVTL